MLLGFANNEFRIQITKPIAQFGLNYQNCRNQIFASLDFSFEGYIKQSDDRIVSVKRMKKSDIRLTFI